MKLKMLVIDQIPKFEVESEDIETTWTRLVRELPLDKRLERIRIGFTDPDIKGT